MRNLLLNIHNCKSIKSCVVISDGHDHEFSRSPIVDQFRRSFSNDRRSSIFLLDHFLTIVDRVIILIVDRDLDYRSPIVDLDRIIII